MAAIKLWKYYEDSGNNMQKQIRTTFPNLLYCSTKEPSESTSIVSSQHFPDTVARGCHSGLLKLQPAFFFFFFQQSKLCKTKSQHSRSCSSRTINAVIFFTGLFSYSVVRRISSKPGFAVQLNEKDWWWSMWSTRGPAEMSFVEIEPYLYYLLILLFLMGVPNSLHTPFSSLNQTHLLFQWNKSMENDIKTEN